MVKKRGQVTKFLWATLERSQIATLLVLEIQKEDTGIPPLLTGPLHSDYALIDSTLQHSSPHPRAKPGRLNFGRLDRSNSRPLGPKW